MQIDLVLFDLGGVLVELGSLPEVLGLADSGRPDDFWSQWLRSPTVRAFERGDLSSERFVIDMVAEFSLTIDADEFGRRFAQLPRGLYPRAAELVAEVAERVEVGLLSNTNALHWEHQPAAETILGLAHPKHHYVSYQLGMVKPDDTIFQRVVELSGKAPSTILFLDDNQPNVDGARRNGLQAELTRGPDQARKILAAYGLAQRG